MRAGEPVLRVGHVSATPCWQLALAPGTSGRTNRSDPFAEIRTGRWSVGGSAFRSSTADRSGGGNRALYFFSTALNGDQPASTLTGLFFVDFQCCLRAFLYSLLALGEIIFLQTRPHTHSARKFAGHQNIQCTRHVSVAAPLATSRRVPCTWAPSVVVASSRSPALFCPRTSPVQSTPPTAPPPGQTRVKHRQGLTRPKTLSAHTKR